MSDKRFKIKIGLIFTLSLYLMTLQLLQENHIMELFPWVTIVLVSVLAAFAAFVAGFCFGAKNTSEEFERKLSHDRERYKQVTDRLNESISQLNRTTNTIIASIVRHNSDGSPLDEQAINQLRRRVDRGELPPIDWDSGSDYNPKNWGRYISHPDEYGYITPFGLTLDKAVAKQWKRVGELILNIPNSDYKQRSTENQVPMSTPRPPLDLEF